MNREDLLTILNNGLRNQFDAQSIKLVITEFVNDKNTEKKLTDYQIDDCIQVLLARNVWQGYYKESIKYLIKKYKINALYSKPTSNIIINGEPQRQIIMYV